ncbi:hypothetical protein ABZN20_10320 [Methylococcus sp. ANG]|uniref:hypothetical protein n=1 Tax=Methylococcus sp. ANG TaxID=3231903 RepID=UPI00345A47D4
MPNLTPVRAYFTIEELADHWKCRVSDVNHMIEAFGLTTTYRCVAKSFKYYKWEKIEWKRAVPSFVKFVTPQEWLSRLNGTWLQDRFDELNDLYTEFVPIHSCPPDTDDFYAEAERLLKKMEEDGDLDPVIMTFEVWGFEDENQDIIHSDESQRGNHVKTTKGGRENIPIQELRREIDEFLYSKWLEHGMPTAAIFLKNLNQYVNKPGSPITAVYTLGLDRGLEWRSSSGNKGAIFYKRLSNIISEKFKKLSTPSEG